MFWGANERLRFAGIGVGGKGSGDIDQAGTLGDVVALCDCDDKSLQAKLTKFPKAKTHYDFRKLFDEMAGQIDAVTISTPDNTHALAAALAMKRGLNVYVQKPLTHEVWEVRWLCNLAREHRVVTQMGNQGTTEDGLRGGGRGDPRRRARTGARGTRLDQSPAVAPSAGGGGRTDGDTTRAAECALG